MNPIRKRKTFEERCPVCGGPLHPLGDEAVSFDELGPDVHILAEVSPGKWVKVKPREIPR